MEQCSSASENRETDMEHCCAGVVKLFRFEHAALTWVVRRGGDYRIIPPHPNAQWRSMTSTHLRVAPALNPRTHA
jgi:hypothetical protein